MFFNADFNITDQSFTPSFGKVNNISDGGYERGYERGYDAGYEKGLAARTYEIWTITLVDGTVVEKEVALL